MRAVRTFSMFCLALSLLIGLPTFADGFYIAPHLQNITKDGVTIIWETQDPGLGVVEYGLRGSYGNEAKAAKTTKIQRVRITGLKPETEYSYRVRTGNDEQASTFKTAPAKDRPIAFVLIGDTRRWTHEEWEKSNMAEHALQWEPEFFLNSGDLVRDGHKYGQWPDHFQRFSDITHNYMLVTARGNHEGSQKEDVENDWFAKYHDFPDPGEPFFSFDWGNTHFVIMSYEDTDNYVEWLDKHLQKVNKKHVIVMHHYPVYCTGYGESYSDTESAIDKRKALGRVYDSTKPKRVGTSEPWKVLDKYNVELHLAGHTHIYERTYPLRGGKRNDRKGVTYLINGGDIGAQFPEWFSAFTDDPKTLSAPMYTVFWALDDRIKFRSFAWSTEKNKIIEIDRLIIWKDASIPGKVLASLPDKEGEELAQAIADLGAMLYEPAVRDLYGYLDHRDKLVQRAAAAAIRSIGSVKVSDKLLAYLNDPDLMVRRQIARALEIAMLKEDTSALVPHIKNKNQDDYVRLSLIGALQFHAPAKLARETCLDLLETEDDVEIRHRAVYALTYVVDKGHEAMLAGMLEKEQDDYVSLRLAYTLNLSNGDKVNLEYHSEEAEALVAAKPGEDRSELIKQLLAEAEGSG